MKRSKPRAERVTVMGADYDARVGRSCPISRLGSTIPRSEITVSRDWGQHSRLFVPAFVLETALRLAGLEITLRDCDTILGATPVTTVFVSTRKRTPPRTPSCVRLCEKEQVREEGTSWKPILEF